MNNSLTYISSKDKSVLRDLGKKVAELASRPCEEEKKVLWYRHNSLQDARPLIFCDPENGWAEIITEKQLQCEGNHGRKWEQILRMEIFWGESMGDDYVIEPFFDIKHSYTETDGGMKEKIIGGKNGGAYTWESPLSDYKDMEKLKFPKIILDYEKTKMIFELTSEIFKEILTVRLKGNWWWSLGLTWDFINFAVFSNLCLTCMTTPMRFIN